MSKTISDKTDTGGYETQCDRGKEKHPLNFLPLRGRSLGQTWVSDNSLCCKLKPV